MNPISHYFNLFYIFFFIIWTPLQLYYLKVDGAGNTVVAFSVVAMIWNIPALWRQKNVLRSPAFLCWTALVLFSFVNSMIKGYESEWGDWVFFKNNFVLPYIFLYVLIVELDWDYDSCLKTLLYALLAYILLCIGNMGLDEDERMVAEGLRNILPLHTTCLVFIGGLLFTQQRLSTFFFWSIVVISIVITMVSGTRKALGAIIILIIGVVFSLDKGEERNLWHYIRLVLFFAVLYIGLSYVMGNTMIGDRLADTAEESKVEFTESETANWFINNLLGDRSIHYDLGFGLFLTHPITGIGITNFRPLSGFPMRLHTEYMTQLCENGIIGFTLLILFYYLIFKKLVFLHREYGENIIMILFGMFALLFLNITVWTYNQDFGMIYYGILITYVYANYDDILIEDNESEWYDEIEETQTEGT